MYIQRSATVMDATFDSGVLAECLIKRGRYAGDDVIKADMVSCEAAVPKGQNYCSVAQRITVEFSFKSGRVVLRPFFVKTNYDNELERRIPLEYGMFESEIRAYQVLLEEMQKLMNRIGDFRPTLWPQFIVAFNESIVLEDLADNGYSVLKQRTGYDLNYSLLVVSELGRLHALSMSLLNRKVVKPEDFPNYKIINGSFVKNIWVSSIRALGVAMERSWGPEWQKAGQRVQAASERVIVTLNSIFLLENSHPKFHTLNHGDCWFVNILFKQNQHGNPGAVKFVDLALVHYNTMAADLTYFLYSSVAPKIRRAHYDELLDKYRSSLLENMKVFGINVSSAPSLEELHNEMERMHFFALVTLTSLYVVLTSSIPINRVSMCSGETSDRKTWCTEHHSSREFQTDIQDDIKKFLEKNVV